MSNEDSPSQYDNAVDVQEHQCRELWENDVCWLRVLEGTGHEEQQVEHSNWWHRSVWHVTIRIEVCTYWARIWSIVPTQCVTEWEEVSLGHVSWLTQRSGRPKQTEQSNTTQCQSLQVLTRLQSVLNWIACLASCRLVQSWKMFCRRSCWPSQYNDTWRTSLSTAISLWYNYPSEASYVSLTEMARPVAVLSIEKMLNLVMPGRRDVVG